MCGLHLLLTRFPASSSPRKDNWATNSFNSNTICYLLTPILNYLLLNLSELILASSLLRTTRPQHHDEVQALRWGPLLDRIAAHGGAGAFTHQLACFYIIQQNLAITMMMLMMRLRCPFVRVPDPSGVHSSRVPSRDVILCMYSRLSGLLSWAPSSIHSSISQVMSPRALCVEFIFLLFPLTPFLRISLPQTCPYLPILYIADISPNSSPSAIHLRSTERNLNDNFIFNDSGSRGDAKDPLFC